MCRTGKNASQRMAKATGQGESVAPAARSKGGGNKSVTGKQVKIVKPAKKAPAKKAKGSKKKKK